MEHAHKVFPSGDGSFAIRMPWAYFIMTALPQPLPELEGWKGNLSWIFTENPQGKVPPKVEPLEISPSHASLQLAPRNSSRLPLTSLYHLRSPAASALSISWLAWSGFAYLCRTAAT